MGKVGIRKKGRKGKKRNGGDVRKADDRGYVLTPHDKQNDAFATYYKRQAIVESEKEWDEMIKAMQCELPTAFRVRGGQSETPALIRLVEKFVSDLADNADADVHVPEAITWCPHAFHTRMSRTAVRSHPILKEFHNFLVTEAELGNISRQEAVSMVPPLLLDVRPEHAILDLCAAPGSKTQQILELMHEDGGQPEGFVVANDVDNTRCYLLVHQALKRMPTTNCVVINEDAAHLPKMHLESDDDSLLFDRVLCDVICSGDGTMRKNPDVWRRWHPQTAIALHKLQVKIAKRGVELLRPGGVMVYSTCSFNPIEDEAIVAQLLRMFKGTLELQDVSQRLPGLLRTPGKSSWTVFDKNMKEYEDYGKVPEAMRTAIVASMFPPTDEEATVMNLHRSFRILPHQQDTGGFFVAVLRKTGDTVVDSEQSLMRIPPAKRQRTFKEDPFVFLEKSEERWENIATHYGITTDFPHEQLLARTADSDKKRTLYFVNAAIKRFLLHNAKVKVVNAGLRMFGRVEMKFESCRFRIAQDVSLGESRGTRDSRGCNRAHGGSRVFQGVRALLPYMRERVLTVSRADMHAILRGSEGSDNCPRGQLQCDADLDAITAGSVVLCTRHQGSGDLHGERGEGGSRQEYAICVWMGKKTVTAYISKEERIHVIRMLGFDTRDLESTMSSKRKEKAARDRVLAEEGKKNGGKCVDDRVEDDDGQDTPPVDEEDGI